MPPLQVSRVVVGIHSCPGLRNNGSEPGQGVPVGMEPAKTSQFGKSPQGVTNLGAAIIAARKARGISKAKSPRGSWPRKGKHRPT